MERVLQRALAQDVAVSWIRTLEDLAAYVDNELFRALESRHMSGQFASVLGRRSYTVGAESSVAEELSAFKTLVEPARPEVQALTEEAREAARGAVEEIEWLSRYERTEQVFYEKARRITVEFVEQVFAATDMITRDLRQQAASGHR
ncbi:MAG: hypothetical protein HYY05_07035 [Chloroflexi bacterium]|nr:hypothetical protein [Chloroflexota bacterium]